MATNTTNYDLIKPAYADAADIADINSNMDVIDNAMNDNATAISSANTAIEANTQAIATNTAAITANSDAIAKVQNGLAYIVGGTNTTGGTLAVGQFVYVKGHSTIAEGLRKVTASISANGNITTSNTSACTEGGLNALNDHIVMKSINVTWETGVAGHCYANSEIMCINFSIGSKALSANTWTTIATIPNTVIVSDAYFSFVDLEGHCLLGRTAANYVQVISKTAITASNGYGATTVTVQ